MSFDVQGRTPGWLRLALTGLVLAIGVIGAVRLLDMEAVVGAFVRADPGIVLAAMVLYLVGWPVRGWRYREVLRSMDHRGTTGLLTAATFISQAANFLIPARAGDGVRAYIVKDRLGVPYNDGVASLLVERVLDLLAVTAIGAIAAVLVIGFGPGVDAATIDDRVLFAAAAVAVGGLILAVAIVGTARWRGRGWRPLDRLPKETRGWLGRMFDATRRGLTDRATLPAILGASAVVWLLDVAVGVFVLAAVYEATPLEGVILMGPAVALAVSVGNLAKTVPLTHGGIGMYEAAFLGIIVASTSVAPELALAIAILDHGIKNAVTLVGGLTAALAVFGRIPGVVGDPESPYF